MGVMTVCPTCGGQKDRRARECSSCGRSRKAVAQWGDPETRARMVESLRQRHKQRRRTFDQITDDTKWQYKADGRAYTYYWEGDRKRYVYRYQWRWIINNGPIPKGHVIHHRNENQTDDRLENLECMTINAHAAHHAPEHSRAAVVSKGLTPITESGICEQCGISFRIRVRAKSNRFCSLGCYHASMRKNT